MSSSTVAVAATAVAFALQGCGGIYEPVTTTTTYVPPPAVGFTLWEKGKYCAVNEDFVKKFNGMAHEQNCADEIATDFLCSDIFYFGTTEGEDNLCTCLVADAKGECNAAEPLNPDYDLDLYRLTGSNAELTCDEKHATRETWKITFRRSRTFSEVAVSDNATGTCHSCVWDGGRNDLEMTWDEIHHSVHHTSDGGATFELQKSHGNSFDCGTPPGWFAHYWEAEMLSV